jgi:hypothetical protein
MNPVALLILFSLALAGIQPSVSNRLLAGELDPLEVSQFTPLTPDAWRPYGNPSSFVQLGMTKSEVLANAGKPDKEESIIQRFGGRLITIPVWYYERTGSNSETTLLTFSGDTLIRIEIIPSTNK